MPVKKTAAAKKAKKTAAKKTAAKKTAAKKGAAKRPATKTAAKKAPAKKSAAKKTASSKKNVKEVKKPKSNRGGFHRPINEETGFVVDTDSDVIAQALLAGGESRAAIIEELEGVLETETRTGTEKAIANMVSGVLNKMLARGYTVEQSFVVVPPTPASKRKAARSKK